MYMILLVLLMLLIGVELFLLYRLVWGLTFFRLGAAGKRLPEADLPTVTVCIPARNEKHAMTSCLEAVVASDYPKLEIIVLDDGSRDSTSLLIKSFAHAGVRFVEGDPLPEGWLGKNHALDTLLGEASGKYVFFMDVDTRIKPQTISMMVDYLLSQKADMISVLPQRYPALRASTVFATMRFFWEIVGHRATSPASVSTAWMVRRGLLADELGGFSQFATATRPDAAVAKQVAAQGRYRFVMGTDLLGVYYEKKWSSQLHTSIRLTYPALGSSWLWSVGAVLLLVLAVVPYVLMVAGLALPISSLILTIAWTAIAVQLIVYTLYIRKIWRGAWWLGGVAALPYLLCVEVWVVIASAVGYSRKSITWKGRPIAATVGVSTKSSVNEP